MIELNISKEEILATKDKFEQRKKDLLESLEYVEKTLEHVENELTKIND